MILKSLIVLISISQYAYASPAAEVVTQVKAASNSAISDLLPDLNWLHAPEAHLASSGELNSDKSHGLEDDNLVMASSMMPGRRRLDDSPVVDSEDLETKSTLSDRKVSRRNGDDFFEDDQNSNLNKRRETSMGGDAKNKKSSVKRRQQNSGEGRKTGGGQESRKKGMKPLIGAKGFGRQQASSSQTVEDLLGNNDEEAEDDDEAERRSGSDSADDSESNDEDDENEQNAEQSRPRPNRKVRPSSNQNANRRSNDGTNESYADEDEDGESSNDTRKSVKAPVPEKGLKGKRKTKKRSSEDKPEKTVPVNEAVAQNEKVEDDESTAAAASNQLKHSSAELQTAAGHHHGHSHGHYYQYAEVPKKKAWKFGYKRGNKKHTSKLELVNLCLVYNHRIHDQFS